MPAKTAGRLVWIKSVRFDPSTRPAFFFAGHSGAVYNGGVRKTIMDFAVNQIPERKGLS